MIAYIVMNCQETGIMKELFYFHHIHFPSFINFAKV